MEQPPSQAAGTARPAGRALCESRDDLRRLEAQGHTQASREGGFIHLCLARLQCLHYVLAFSNLRIHFEIFYFLVLKRISLPAGLFPLCLVAVLVRFLSVGIASLNNLAIHKMSSENGAIKLHGSICFRIIYCISSSAKISVFLLRQMG